MKNVIKVYDKGNVSRDRYTIITDLKTYKLGNSTIYKSLILSEDIYNHNAVSVWNDCVDINIHSNIISFNSLPENLKHHIEFRINLYNRAQKKINRRVSIIGDVV